jgi:hypothetical protein
MPPPETVDRNLTSFKRFSSASRDKTPRWNTLALNPPPESANPIFIVSPSSFHTRLHSFLHLAGLTCCAQDAPERHHHPADHKHGMSLPVRYRVTWPHSSYLMLLEQNLTSTFEGGSPQTLSRSGQVSDVGGSHLAVQP